MIVLDSSAVLALLHDEPGADAVNALLARSEPGALGLGAANLAELIGKGGDAGIHAKRVLRLLDDAGVSLEPVTPADGQLAGALRAIAGGRTLSLGDRCCLALTLRSRGAEVWTGDRAWADLELPIQVRLIR